MRYLNLYSLLTSRAKLTRAQHVADRGKVCSVEYEANKTSMPGNRDQSINVNACFVYIMSCHCRMFIHVVTVLVGGCTKELDKLYARLPLVASNWTSVVSGLKKKC